MEILGSKKLTKKDLLKKSRILGSKKLTKKKLTKKDRRDARVGEEQRKRRKERGSGRAKRARWCEEAWEEGRGAKRAREAQGRAKRQQNLI